MAIQSLNEMRHRDRIEAQANIVMIHIGSAGRVELNEIFGIYGFEWIARAELNRRARMEAARDETVTLRAHGGRAVTYESSQERAIALVALYGAEERAAGLAEGMRALDDLQAIADAAASPGRVVSKKALVEAIRVAAARFRREHADALMLVRRAG